ncbi:ATP-binding protein [Litoribacillus peritrichatus]|uniref:histidine kinase n=1 Tax=Litoribacillus peritrichatus TaxID=718191 RepID=A0ABP7N4F2_9GAMM
MSEIVLEKLNQNKNLKLLFWLRNIAILGQLLSVLFVHFGLDISLPIEPMLVSIAVLVLVNVFTGFRLKQQQDQLNISNHEVFVQLLIDVAALAVLIYFSGGASNPFIGFFILQVVIAAILLTPKQTWAIVAVTGLAYLLLSYFNYEVQGLSNHSMSANMHHGMHGDMAGANNDDIFNMHLHGMLLGYLITAILVALFVVQMSKNLRERDQELYRIQQQAYSEAEILKLGMLAAGAAHELGTPLNAIQLISDELKESLIDQDQFKPTLNLLERQVNRCSQSLNDLMTVVRQPRAMSATEQSVNRFVNEVADNWCHLNPSMVLEKELTATDDTEIITDKLLAQAIINLLDNAARVSSHFIRIITRQENNSVDVIIEDTGSGMPEHLKKMLENNMPITDQNGNVRLGLFLVKTLVQRIGGALIFNKSEVGASQVILRLPTVPYKT